jgi:hypothetical protein
VQYGALGRSLKPSIDLLERRRDCRRRKVVDFDLSLLRQHAHPLGGESERDERDPDRPARLGRYLHESTYHLLIGLLGAKPNITAFCYFADPVADITVLGAPDNQSLGDECGQYEAFVEALPPFDVAPPWPPSRMRFAGFKDQPPAFPSVEVAVTAHLLSLDSAWLDDVARHKGGGLWTEPEGLTVNGMSGSPLISTTAAAIGVVSTNNIVPCLVNGLPGWLLRELR